MKHQPERPVSSRESEGREIRRLMLCALIIGPLLWGFYMWLFAITKHWRQPTVALPKKKAPPTGSARP